MAKLVRGAMTANPRTLRVGASVLDAARLMEEEDVGSIPVVDNGQILVGMVTDRDIVLRVVAAGKDPGTTAVETVATRDISPASPDESLDEALQQMAERQVRRLPVIEADRVVVGILAQADVAHEAKAKKAGQLVEEISQPSEAGLHN
ncbi:MAG TPA: CBS domain-containing protein [Gaiellaceae bacterium]|nr:CBS domain-containing protein [Gaiellaceae bacterium]